MPPCQRSYERDLRGELLPRGKPTAENVATVSALATEQGEKVKYELIWHSVNDVHFLVEADTEEDAMGRLRIWLCDPDEENGEGIEQL
jgi:hypothetical protein